MAGRGVKRGRNGNGAPAMKRARAAVTAAGGHINWPRVFAKGKDRTGGYYGRFAHNGSAGAELKFHDVDLDDALIATPSALTASINLIPQGVTEKTRVGRKCVIRAINWHYQLSLAEQVDKTSPSSGDTVRVILYQDKQCNGATATATGLMETDDWQSFRNLANSGRFKILMDRTHNINFMTLTSTQNADTFDQANVLRDYSFYKKCAIPIEFDATTGAITEIRSNNIGVLLMAPGGASVGFESKFRLRFSDGA